MQEPSSALLAAFSDHSRTFGDLRHVYPVLSRRSRGLSIGVNLNLDRICNYDCPYCQVDRRIPSPRIPVDVPLLVDELGRILSNYARTGLAEAFPGIPAEQRVLRDIALSGDGEPTLDASFPQICGELALIQSRWREAGGTPFRLVCITNATRLDNPAVLDGLAALCALDGQVWAKLDAGTDAWQKTISGSNHSVERIVSNISIAAARVPTLVQTLWMEWNGAPPRTSEVDAWIANIASIHARSPLQGVQIHTVARATSKPGCRPLDLAWLESVGDRIRALGVAVDIHGGIDAGAIDESRPLPP